MLVPATKQEATFEFTQETKDGIPLRFKGVIIYRITDPAAAMLPSIDRVPLSDCSTAPGP